MKRFRLLLVTLLMALLCVPLTGCDDVVENTGTVLEGCDIAYQGVMQSSAMAYRQNFITKDTLVRITCFSKMYHSSWKAAVTALQEYQKVEASGDAVKKEVARMALDSAVALARTRLSELKEYWCEAKEAYEKLKDRHDE